VAKRKGIDHVLVLNVWQVESQGYQNAVSEAGALGVGQIMPFHFRSIGIADIGKEEWEKTIKWEVKRWGRKYVEHSVYRKELEKAFDAKKNVTGSVGILASSIKSANGNIRKGLAIYNGGGYGAKKFNEGYPCAPYVKGKINDCLQNKHYVKNIYSAYVGDLKKMGEPT
jgi:soluble lytic murein transglycosylase-like protein